MVVAVVTVVVVAVVTVVIVLFCVLVSFLWFLQQLLQQVQVRWLARGILVLDDKDCVVVVCLAVSGSPPHQVAFWNEVAESKFDFQDGKLRPVRSFFVLCCIVPFCFRICSSSIQILLFGCQRLRSSALCSSVLFSTFQQSASSLVLGQASWDIWHTRNRQNFLSHLHVFATRSGANTKGAICIEKDCTMKEV